LVYLWAVGILPLAYLLASPALAMVAIIAAAIGLGWEIASLSAGLFPALSLYLAFGVMLYSLGELHRRGGRWVELHAPYTMFGLFIALGTLYLLSFRYVWEGSAASP